MILYSPSAILLYPDFWLRLVYLLRLHSSHSQTGEGIPEAILHRDAPARHSPTVFGARSFVALAGCYVFQFLDFAGSGGWRP